MHLVDKSQPLPGSRSVSEFYKRALYTKQVGQFHGLLRRLMRRDTTVLLCLFPCKVFATININSVCVSHSIHVVPLACSGQDSAVHKRSRFCSANLLLNACGTCVRQGLQSWKSVSIYHSCLFFINFDFYPNTTSQYITLFGIRNVDLSMPFTNTSLYFEIDKLQGESCFNMSDC